LPETETNTEPPQYDYGPAPSTDALPPDGGATRKAPPRLEGRGVQQSDGTTKLEGTITLDIDPTTGLIADPSVCPVIRSKTFAIGQEPRKYCGPEYHNGKAIQPTATRPRYAAPR
jgi:hypothetical protein